MPSDNIKMNWAYRIAIWLKEKNIFQYLPWRSLKAYVYPFTIPGKKKTYNASIYFESYYRSVSEHEFTDRITIEKNTDPLHAWYHYNNTENSIIRGLNRFKVPENPTVIDIGSGAGHWIDFYRNILNPSYIAGLEISGTCADKLRNKYKNSDEVWIVEGDISDTSLELERSFDIVNAIGIIFHIVDDNRWFQALVNMRQLLNDQGIIFIGGHCGRITQNVQFHLSDQFNGKEEIPISNTSTEVLINKRIRSLRCWKRTAKKAGLKVQWVIRTKNAPEILTPENNIIILKRILNQ